MNLDVLNRDRLRTRDGCGNDSLHLCRNRSSAHENHCRCYCAKYVSWFHSASRSGLLLKGIGVDVDTEGANGDAAGKNAKLLLFNLNPRLRSKLDGCIDGVRSHTPKLSGARDRCTVNRKLDVLLGV